MRMCTIGAENTGKGCGILASVFERGFRAHRDDRSLVDGTMRMNVVLRHCDRELQLLTTGMEQLDDGHVVVVRRMWSPLPPPKFAVGCTIASAQQLRSQIQQILQHDAYPPSRSIRSTP